jgi:tetratricopeptide (TPR) repeat protein
MSNDEVLGYWHFLRALEWEKQGDFSKAITDYRAAIAAYPRTGQNANNLSWLLSTCPNALFRNGPQSVELAEGAVATQPRNEDYLDTEACAYAELGNFVKATEIEDKVVQVMPTDDFVARRNGFRNHKACHDDVQPQVRQKRNTRLQGNH